MSSLLATVIRAMPPKGSLKRYRVGILINGNIELAEGLLCLGHRTVIISDRFHPMYRLLKRHRRASREALFETSVMVEASLDCLPIARESLDVLILTGGLVARGVSPEVRLRALKKVIRPGGTIIWPERISDGFLGTVSRLIRPFKGSVLGPVPRRTLCHCSMAAGLREIGQLIVPKTTLPWVVTHARVGKNPLR